MDQTTIVLEGCGHVLICPIDTMMIGQMLRHHAGAVDHTAARPETVNFLKWDNLSYLNNSRVCIVHHAGKDTPAGARGHSSFFAALDKEITVTRFGEHDIRVKCTNQKDALVFEDMQFVKVSVKDSIILQLV